MLYEFELSLGELPDSSFERVAAPSSNTLKVGDVSSVSLLIVWVMDERNNS